MGDARLQAARKVSLVARIDSGSIQELPESRAARALISQYESDIRTILDQINEENLDAATRLASVPDLIRGYGNVRQRKTIEANEFRMENLAELLGQPMTPKDNIIAKAS